MKASVVISHDLIYIFLRNLYGWGIELLSLQKAFIIGQRLPAEQKPLPVKALSIYVR
jgi:hypothetical protein